MFSNREITRGLSPTEFAMRHVASPLLLVVAGACAMIAYAAPAAPAAADADAAADPRETEVRLLLDRYFKSWSNQDLLRYGQCFMPQAAVQLIDPVGRLVTMPLEPFLKSQYEAHKAAKNRLTETAESVEIRFDAELAHALVYWKLVDGERTEVGYDHFTLMKSEGKWRIANLVFYSVKPPAEATPN